MKCDMCFKRLGKVWIDVAFKRDEVLAVIEGHPAHTITRELFSGRCCSSSCATEAIAWFKQRHLVGPDQKGDDGKMQRMR